VCRAESAEGARFRWEAPAGGVSKPGVCPIQLVVVDGVVLFAIGGNMPVKNLVPLGRYGRLTLLPADDLSSRVAIVSKIQGFRGSGGARSGRSRLKPAVSAPIVTLIT
jgi:hypothetical protein